MVLDTLLARCKVCLTSQKADNNPYKILFFSQNVSNEQTRWCGDVTVERCFGRIAETVDARDAVVDICAGFG